MACDKILLLLLSPPAWLARQAFRATVLDSVVPRVLERARPLAAKLTMTTEAPPPRVSTFPFRRESVALLSLTLRDETPTGLGRAAGFAGWRLDGYRADASRPVSYDRDWPAGQPTPGVGLLTLFRRRRGLDDATFIRRWHGSHTPLSLEIHPLWCYVRNVVERVALGDEAATPDPVTWDGIVEEHFRQRADLLDPRRFFGGLARMLPNMVRVAHDVHRFIDLKTIRTYLVDEQHLVVD